MGASVDPRIEQYARLLIERSLDVRPGWQVLIRTQPEAQPLIEELIRLIAERGAYPLLRMNFTLFPNDEPWATEAPVELVGEIAPIDLYASDHMDARITVEAPDNTRGVAEMSSERRALMKRASAPFFRRTMADEIPWVGCQFPTNAYAQEAGMTLAAFEDFFYGACLRDWDAESKAMHRLLSRFDEADHVRIVGNETDLALSLRGRKGEVDDGRVNVPGGEFFFSPREDSAEGTIYLDVPTELETAPVSGIRLTFRKGRVEEASAEQGEAELLAALAIDDGARFVGELGIGCNTGITRPMRNILYDEKMAGSVHIALGASYPKVGGTNVSSLHWDLIKDLREGGRIELDGEVVQENGSWLI
jgi:aminopeptidase